MELVFVYYSRKKKNKFNRRKRDKNIEILKNKTKQTKAYDSSLKNGEFMDIHENNLEETKQRLLKQ